MSDFGIPIVRSPYVPRGKAFLVAGQMIVGTFVNLGPVPGWTRHMLGVREAQRDRRLYG